MNKTEVGVIAGTLVDTKMGVDFLISKGISAEGYPISSTPEEQSKIQILSPSILADEVRNKIQTMREQGINNVFVYCNSMCAAIDMEQLALEEKTNIITPYFAYKKIANKYSLIGVLAGNNQSVAGIERVIQNSNLNCNILGLGILPLVSEIEKGEDPSNIIKKFSIDKILEFYNNNNVDAILLGCTHFPILLNELKKYTNIEIIDPAEMMFKMIDS